MFTNLSTLPIAELSLVPEPGERLPAPARRAVLGPEAWVQPVLVTWRLTGEERAATHRVWLTFTPDAGEARLAGTFDGPAGGSPAQVPSWWLGPVTAETTGGVTVVAGSGQSPDRWAGVVQPAVAAVRRALPTGVADRRAGTVVVEVPATPADFAAVLGQPADRYAGIAAVVHAAGEGDRAPLRMVVNPRAGTLVPAATLTEIVRHEVVHLATRSPESPAPLWVVEGLAEWAALREPPGRVSAGTAGLLASVRRDGPPRSLPADAAFAAGEQDLNRAYAQSWLACRYVAETYSAAGLGRFYAELDGGATVDVAARSALGTSAADLTAGWRRFLVRQAGSG